MPWQICITLPQEGEICIDIPLLPNWRFREPDPDPLRWISKGVIDPSWEKDLPIIATIDRLASNLSNVALRKALQGAMQSGVKQPALKGVAINFKATKG
jgi:hypothetical protein